MERPIAGSASDRATENRGETAPYNRAHMPITPGTHLGAYEIVALIGQGGMGEVYRARDTKLGREVALKILPATFTSDPERVARFRREAQVLAALNHRHIAQIYGLEEADGTPFLELELVDGESLDKRSRADQFPSMRRWGLPSRWRRRSKPRRTRASSIGT